MSAPDRVVSIEQAWPGRRSDLSALPPRLPVAERIVDRRGLVLVTAALRYASEELFGLGLWLSVNGPTFVSGGLIHPDDRPDLATALSFWAKCQSPSFSISSLSAFFQWRTGLFRHDIYSGGGWLLSADLGRTLGLVCNWTLARGHRWRDDFTLWPPTWSTLVLRSDGHRVRRSVSPNLPPIRIKAAGAHGYFAEFGRAPGGSPCGKRNPDGTHYRGRFLDVIPASFALLDGIDSDRLSDHLSACGLSPIDVPPAVVSDEGGADQLLSVARSIWDLALALDHEVAR